MFKPLTKQQYDSAIASGFTPSQIIANEKIRKEKETPKQPNYFERVAQEYNKAGQDIVSGFQEGAKKATQGDVLGGQNTALLRTVGGVAGATFAPITEAPIIKPALEAIGTGISKIPGVDTLVQKATELAQKHPESAKDLQNIIDIATLAAGSGAQKPVAKVLEKAGANVERSGLASMDVAKNTFAQELVKPVETTATKLEQVRRTTEAGGLFKKDIVTPTASEVLSAKEVAQIPGISAKNTFQRNYNLVRDFNVKQAKQLESDIAKYDFIIPKKEVISKLDAVANTLKTENPLIVGDAEKTANKLIAGAKKIIQENEGKGSGLLKARKEYDSWVLSQKPKAFDAKAENAFTIANDAIRQTMNTVLDENAINVGVKDSLRKQSSLYRAMENIAPKAAEEANTVFGRTLQRIGKTLGTRNKLVQTLAAATGVGVFGAATTFAMPLTLATGAGFLLYRGGKFLVKPEVRVAIGKLLKESGNLLSPADKATMQKILNFNQD